MIHKRNNQQIQWLMRMGAGCALLQFDAECFCEILEVVSGGEVGRAEAHVDRCRRCELLPHGLEDGLDKGGADLDFPDHDLHSLRTLSDSEGDVFKAYGLLTRLLEALESPGAGVELATRARDEAAWLHVVNLDSFLAP